MNTREIEGRLLVDADTCTWGLRRYVLLPPGVKQEDLIEITVTHQELLQRLPEPREDAADCSKEIEEILREKVSLATRITFEMVDKAMEKTVREGTLDDMFGAVRETDEAERSAERKKDPSGCDCGSPRCTYPGSFFCRKP